MNTLHAETVRPLAWLVEFENLPMPGSSFDGSGAMSCTAHLTYEEPEGCYLDCAQPIYDEHLVNLTSRALGGTPGRDAHLEAVTASELLMAELVGNLISQAYHRHQAEQARPTQPATPEVVVPRAIPNDAFNMEFQAALHRRLEQAHR